ncbi:MAG: hypothetical protein LBB08_02105 [Rickettsiales bacterium]|jgi:hypothetical protein|nr:hypothetical protein [Rickettsiales bacterium]
MMRSRLVLTVFFLLPAAAVSAPDEKFIDCGPGYTIASEKSVYGIPVSKCNKIWCRDLENGKPMGRGDSANSGYEDTKSGPEDLCDNKGNCVPCFGKRKWCSGETPAEFDPELGIYAKNGADGRFYRGSLKNNCYEWKIQNLRCAEGKKASFVGGEWKCLGQGPEASIAARAAVKTQAVRRTAGIIMPIKKR